MTIPGRSAIILIFSLSALVIAPALSRAQSKPSEIGVKPIYQGAELTQLMKRIMEYQVKVYGDKPSINWQAAPFWVGVLATNHATGDRAFYDEAKKWADGTQWKISQRFFHADDTAVGQAYEEMYLHDKDPRMIADLKPKIEQYLTKKTVTNREVAHGPAEAEWKGRNVWWWCDALFMAPPMLARMSAVTGDQRYLALLHSMFWDTTDFLFDPSEGFYFRDESYFFDKKKSPTGKKVFWGRGNGWVYGGIIRTLDYIPKDDPQRQKYIDLYKKMTESVVKYQQADGLWRASVNEPTWISQPESSCSAFFTFGILAGINRGYLDRNTYLPIALKGWDGLCGLIHSDGGIGFAQQVGAAPEAFTADSKKEYAQGAFLLAGSELYTMKLTPQELQR